MKTICGIALVVVTVGGCSAVDNVFCDNGNCGWTDHESAELSALTGLPAEPPVDTSNKYAENLMAQQLGRKFFSDPRFSGYYTGNDEIGRPMLFGRVAKGQALNMSCASCHDLKNGGADTATMPGNVSIGASWTTLNTPTVINVVFQPLLMWGARIDSLWAQPVGAIEASMGSNRARAAWTVASFYRAEYDAIFTEYPLPLQGTIAQLLPTLSTDPAKVGQCLMNPECPSSCRSVKDDASGATGCFPRFVLDGKPGKKAGCQPGDAAEPFGDAFDCMAMDDQVAVKRVIVNFAKAIGAFESRLISRDSAFDQFMVDVRAGRANESTIISSDAKKGAQLFVGKAGCVDCHNTPLLSDSKFYNVGVPDIGAAVATESVCPKGGTCDCVTPNNCLPWGVRDGLVKLQKHPYLRTSSWSDDSSDLSRQMYMDMSPGAVGKGSYRTPSLRDVALTAPYMHDGALPTLEAVVAHYNRGGDPSVYGDRSARIKPLNLSDNEQSQLVAFLKTLTGAPLPSELADLPELPR
ncbi:MAG: cytochrome c peroxidase [Myxococcales bacterium]